MHHKRTNAVRYAAFRPMEQVIAEIATDWMTSRLIYARYRLRGGSHSIDWFRTILCQMRAEGMVERRCKRLRSVRATRKASGFATHTWEFRATTQGS